MSVDPGVLAHNRKVLDTLEEGDLIQIQRGIYSHWATYIGAGEVVHLTGNDGGRMNSTSENIFTICGETYNKAKVVREDFLDVAGTSVAKKNNGNDSELRQFDRRTIKNRALSKLGRIEYNLLWKNCEHFASWCRYGEERSDQATSVLTGAAICGISAGIAYGIYSFNSNKNRGQKKGI